MRVSALVLRRHEATGVSGISMVNQKQLSRRTPCVQREHLGIRDRLKKLSELEQAAHVVRRRIRIDGNERATWPLDTAALDPDWNGRGSQNIAKLSAALVGNDQWMATREQTSCLGPSTLRP